MKKIYTYTLMLIATLALTFNAFTSKAQNELVFTNPTLTGTAGAVGAIYRFANVATGVDALVKINDRSSSLVTLSSIDLSSSGYANAFQPQIAYNNGNAPKNTTWYMEFLIQFVKSTDNTMPVTLNSFDVTSIDMDGDDNKLREQATFYGLKSYTLENPSAITVSSVTNGKIYTGSYTNYSNISTTATSIMVTSHYEVVSSFTVRVGGTTGNATSSLSERMSSLWFKSFTYSAPQVTLPVELEYFTAKKESNATVLNWATAKETNFGHFAVQRSNDGVSYSDIAIVFGDNSGSNAGNAYTYTDKSNQGKVAYYRLNMVDKDGSSHYSPVKIIRNTDDKEVSIATFPNPATSQVRVTIPNDWQNQPVTYSIYNISGGIIRNKVCAQAAQTETFNISDLKAGTYFIKATAGGSSGVKQFVKAG